MSRSRRSHADVLKDYELPPVEDETIPEIVVLTDDGDGGGPAVDTGHYPLSKEDVDGLLTPEPTYEPPQKDKVGGKVAVTVAACVATGALAFLCVSNASAALSQRQQDQAAAVQAQIDAKVAAERQRQAEEERARQEVEAAIETREKERESASAGFGDRVIELRPEQTPEEIAQAESAAVANGERSAEGVAEDAVSVGVDGETLSPATDGRAAWVVLEEGDTLQSIAEYFNTDVASIMELNGFTQDTKLFAGDKVRVF